LVLRGIWAMPNDDVPATSDNRQQEKNRDEALTASPARDDDSTVVVRQPFGKAIEQSEPPPLSSGEGPRPPLPPRPTNLSLLQESTSSPENRLQTPRKVSRPGLQSTATTALSRTDIHTQSRQDGSRETYAASPESTPPTNPSKGYGSIRKFKGLQGSEGTDSASVRSYAPTLEVGGDAESLLGDILGAAQDNPAWKLFSDQAEAPDIFSAQDDDNEVTADFYREFDDLRAIDAGGSDEGKYFSDSIMDCS